MALTTFGKLAQHRFRMGAGVACKARRYDFVFGPVTKCACKVVVFGRVLFKQAQSLLVTGPAIMGGSILRVSNLQRPVHRMARNAGLEVHVFSVLLMAIHAARDLPVHAVAFVASQIRVCTGVTLDFVSLLLMTCKTGLGNLSFQFQIKRGMGIGVTLGTSLQFIMRLAAMAHATLWYGIRTLWRVFAVTVQTADLGLVFLSALSYGLGLLWMAHDTQGVGQGRDCLLS